MRKTKRCPRCEREVVDEHFAFHVDNCAVLPLSVEEERRREERVREERQREAERKREQEEAAARAARPEEQERARVAAQHARTQAAEVAARAAARWQLYELEEMEGDRRGCRVLIYRQVGSENDRECRVWSQVTRNTNEWRFARGETRNHDILIDGRLFVCVGLRRLGDTCDQFLIRRVEEIDGTELAARERFMMHGQR